MVDRTARCENGHEFPVKQEYLGHDAGAGSPVVKWMPGKVEGIVECPVPNCLSTRFELVEE
jgi:hypothetical protein